MKPHKWAKEIKAWANGAEIEIKYKGCDWQLEHYPYWHSDEVEFRIKQQPKELQYLYVWFDKDTEIAELYLNEPKGMLEDDLCKYIGKIKLETKDD